MKQIFKYGFISLTLAATLSSCTDTMDTHPASSFTDEVIWSSKSTVQAFINNIYNSVITGADYAGSGSSVYWEARTPNSVKCSQVSEGIDGVATELGISTSSDFGTNFAGYLRKCNLVIENVAANEKLSDNEKNELISQAKLLRGMIFFNQAKKIGRFVPITIVLDTENPEAANIPMTKSVAESYEYAITDLQAGADGLPSENVAGLPTKWAAKVILSRAALQAYAYTKDAKYLDLAVSAASDCINNSGASLATGLTPSKSLWNETDPNNEEILWAYYRNKDNTQMSTFAEVVNTYPNISPDDVASSLCPVTLRPNARSFEAWAIYFPTQDMIDQFLVTDEQSGQALPWYETSQYKANVDVLDPASVTKAGQVDAYTRKNGEDRRIPTPQDLLQTKDGYATFLRYHQLKAASDRNLSELMYTGRDKRFYTAIVYDGCTWLNESVETNLGGNFSQGVRDREDGGWYNTVTGYYWRKGNVENPDPRAFWTVKIDHHFNLARLGEAYLNLAEAYLLKGDISGAVTALNATRTAHGGLAPSTASTEAEAWADYIRERNCEMCNEGGDIYFSYLRWGKYGGYANHGRSAGGVIADLDRPAYKMEISRDRTQLLVGQVTLLNSANRNFTDRRYLFPINQGFLDTRAAFGLDAVQNEGW